MPIRCLDNNETPQPTFGKITAGLAYLLGGLLVARHLFFIEIPLAVVTALCLCVLLLGVRGKVNVNIPLVGLLAALALSLALHLTPAPALRTQRFIAFAIALMCFSPLIANQRLQYLRRLIWSGMIAVMGVMVVVSFFIWLLSNLWEEVIPYGKIYYFGFRGVFDYGMTLSPVAGIISIVAFDRLFSGHESRRGKTGLFVLTIIALIMTLAAGSRIAVVGLAVALCCIVIFNRGVIGRWLKSIRIVAVMLAIASLFAVLLPEAVSVIQRKNSVGNEHNSVFYSRQHLWTARMDEFLSSPLTGIGYANEIQQLPESPASLNTIEPGSSWLSVMSYGGILAGLMALWFIADIVKRIWNGRKDSRTPGIASLLLFMVINGIAEGWLLFAGALMFPIFWLTCATLASNKYSISI